MKFKGFDDWVEIFRGGKQTDSNGREHDGDSLIDNAVKFFAPGSHEPPLVVGHPRDDAPAFGWVEKLKKTAQNGQAVLMARFKEVVPEFETLAKKGLYKKRSASFYPDGRLRHVGFLGAAPPAVKGLADLNWKFSDEEALSFDFYDPAMGTFARILRNLRDWLIEKEGKEAADAIIPDRDVEYMRMEADKPDTEPDAGFAGEEDKMTFKEFMEAFKFWKEVEADPGATPPGASPGGNFTEADLEKTRKDAQNKGRLDAEAAFAEKTRQDAKSARDKEVLDWCEQRVKDGKLVPSWADAGLVAFMQGLDAEAAIEFAEGKEKKSPYAWFREVLEGFGESAIFKELATKDAAGDSADFAESKKDQALGEAIAAKVA